MKANTHPKYVKSNVTCTTCGHAFEIFSLKPETKIDVCSNCHQFYIGKTQFKRSASRVEKFNKKYSR